MQLHDAMFVLDDFEADEATGGDREGFPIAKASRSREIQAVEARADHKPTLVAYKHFVPREAEG